MDYTGFRDLAPIIDHHMEQNMENELATVLIEGIQGPKYLGISF